MLDLAHDTIVIALPKGRILKEAAPLFARAGIQPEAAFADPEARQGGLNHVEEPQFIAVS